MSLFLNATTQSDTDSDVALNVLLNKAFSRKIYYGSSDVCKNNLL